MKIKRNEKELKFDIIDNDRTIFTLNCVNNVHFYCVDFALKNAKTFKEIQGYLKEVKDSESETSSI